MLSIDGKQVTPSDIGRPVYVVCRDFTLFGELCRVNSDFVFVRGFDLREHACDAVTVHWGSHPESQYKQRRI